MGRPRLVPVESSDNCTARRRTSRKRRPSLGPLPSTGVHARTRLHRTQTQKGPSMKRSTTAVPLLVLTAALLSPAGAATAAPPGDGSFTDMKAAGAACPFAIQVDVTG